MKRFIRVLLALMLSFFLCFSDVLRVCVSAEQNSDDLPFSFEETDYGIEVDAVNGKKLVINSEKVEICDTCLSNLLFLKEKISEESYKLYILCPKGLIKTFEFSSNDEWYSNICESSYYAMKCFKVFRNGINRTRYEDYDSITVSGWYTDTIYLVKNQNNKYDLININEGKYFDYSFDSIKCIDSNIKDSFFVYKQNNKFGILDCHGKKITDAIYEDYQMNEDGDLVVFENPSVYETKAGLITRDGSYNGELEYDWEGGCLRKEKVVILTNHISTPIIIDEDLDSVSRFDHIMAGSESIIVYSGSGISDGSYYFYNLDGTKTDLALKFGGKDCLECTYTDDLNGSYEPENLKYITLSVGKKSESSWGAPDVYFKGIIDEHLNTIVSLGDEYHAWRYGDYFGVNKRKNPDEFEMSYGNVINCKGQVITVFDSEVCNIKNTSRYLYVKLESGQNAIVSLKDNKSTFFDGDIDIKIFDDELAIGGLQYIYYYDKNNKKYMIDCIDSGIRYEFLDSGYAEVIDYFIDSELHILIRDQHDTVDTGCYYLLNEALEKQIQFINEAYVLSPNLILNYDLYRSDGSLYENEEHSYYWDVKDRCPKMTPFVRLRDSYAYKYGEEQYLYINTDGERIIDDCYYLSEFFDGTGFYVKHNNASNSFNGEIGIIDINGDAIICGDYYNRFNGGKHGPYHYEIEMGGNGIILCDTEKNYIFYNWDLSAEHHTKDRSSVENCTFKTSFNDKELTFYNRDGEGFYYYDSYFDLPATQYQHSLATMSLCMAFSTYGYGAYSGYDKNVKILLKQCGFTEKGRYKQYHFNEKPEAYSIGCAIGSKIINDTTVIAVAVRGGGYEAEWTSNIGVGGFGDHYGFDKAADNVKDYITSYIEKMNIEGNVKIWLTGFSRAGATATQTAAKLNKMNGYSYIKNDHSYSVSFGKEDIYAYGFATPAGADFTTSNPESTEYNNIFSIIDYNDLVPLVAPEQWKFTRYGVTKILPYKEGNNSKEFSKYFKRIKNKMGAGYKVDSFKNYSYNYLMYIDAKAKGDASASVKGLIAPIPNLLNHDSLGTFQRKLISALAKTIGSRGAYTNRYQSGVESTVYKLQHDGKLQLNNLVWNMIIDVVPGVIPANPDLTATLYANLDKLIDVHANPRYYVYWMQLMDENYENNLPVKWGCKNYRLFRADCPVDLYVYDSNGTEVGSIINNVPQENTESSIITSIDENDRKVVYLPVDGDYHVEIKAADNCEVSCGVEEYSAEYGEATRITNFDTVKMNKNETMDATVLSFSDEELEEDQLDGSNVEYSLEKDADNIQIMSDIKGTDNVNDHTYSVEVSYDETKGTVYGCGMHTEGSYVIINAITNPGNIFEGFYIDGIKVDKYTDDNNIRIQVNSDIKLEARFVECKHKFDDSQWVIVKEATKNNKGTKKNICKICGYEITEEYSFDDDTSGDKKDNKPGDSKDGTGQDDQPNNDDYKEAGSGIGKISSDGKFLIDNSGKIFYMSDKLTNEDIFGYVFVADKKSNGKYKITKVKTKKEKDSKGYHYTLVSGTVEYVGLYNTNSKTAKIPDSIKLKGVTFKVVSISNNALKGSKKLKKITIGKNITQIGNNAFYGCAQLTDVTIGKSVTKIGKNVFYGCKKLKKITIKSTKLKKIGSKTFKGIYSKAKFKVPKKNLKKYKKIIKKAGAPKKVKITK